MLKEIRRREVERKSLNDKLQVECVKFISKSNLVSRHMFSLDQCRLLFCYPRQIAVRAFLADSSKFCTIGRVNSFCYLLATYFFKYIFQQTLYLLSILFKYYFFILFLIFLCLFFQSFFILFLMDYIFFKYPTTIFLKSPDGNILKFFLMIFF